MRKASISSDEGTYGERLEPIGAAEETQDHLGAPQRSQCTEDDHDQLDVSLLALTTHFAQVQFRLRQVVNASAEEREDLLASLEAFAFKGIPSVLSTEGCIDENSLVMEIKSKRVKQLKLLKKLRCNLSRLKEEVLSERHVKKRRDIDALVQQKLILKEIKERLNLSLDDGCGKDLSTPAAVRQRINVALERVTESINAKEELLKQIMFHLEDLEQYVKLLQKSLKSGTQHCGCIANSEEEANSFDLVTTFKKVLRLLNMLFNVYIACGLKQFRKNNLKNTAKCNHWGDLRAELELAILRVRNLLLDVSSRNTGPNSSKVVTVILQHLAPSIRDLMQHGVAISNSNALELILCMPLFAKSMHAWMILLDYYNMKEGERFNSFPVRMLSQSFDLNINSASPQNDKEHLLLTIGEIISLYRTYKRDCDDHFKAFICAALNAKKLASWMNIIFQCDTLIKLHYLPWSYVAQTRFRDGCDSLDTLTDFRFDLPVDFAIRRFTNTEGSFN